MVSRSYWYRRYCIGKYRGHIVLVDIVLVKYRGHIVLVDICEKFFFPKKCSFLPKNALFWPKNGQKWPKYRQNIEKYRKIVQKLPFFIVLVLYWSSKKFFLCRIGIESIFGPKMTLVLVLGRKIFGNFFYRIGIEMDFLAKNFGYWCCIDLTKIQNAELCMK